MLSSRSRPHFVYWLSFRLYKPLAVLSYQEFNFDLISFPEHDFGDDFNRKTIWIRKRYLIFVVVTVRSKYRCCSCLVETAVQLSGTLPYRVIPEAGPRTFSDRIISGIKYTLAHLITCRQAFLSDRSISYKLHKITISKKITLSVAFV